MHSVGSKIGALWAVLDSLYNVVPLKGSNVSSKFLKSLQKNKIFPGNPCRGPSISDYYDMIMWTSTPGNIAM